MAILHLGRAKDIVAGTVKELTAMMDDQELNSLATDKSQTHIYFYKEQMTTYHCRYSNWTNCNDERPKSGTTDYR